MFSPRIEQALTWVARRHAGQRRKVTGLPYWTHPVHVAWILDRHGHGEESQIAALLHDVLEDTCKDRDEVTRVSEQIAAEFGEIVRRAVEEASEQKFDPEGHKIPWRDRKAAFVARLPEASPTGLAVVTADKIHNLASLLTDLERLGDSLWDHFSSTPEESLTYHRKVLEISRTMDDLESLTREFEASLDRLARAVSKT